MAGEPILIVDDTIVNLKLTRVLLIHEGYRVLTAASAEEALEILETHRPWMVLTDIQLPGIDGLELTRRIKSGEKTRDIMVVALAAFATAGDQEEVLKAGCDGYISKPVDTRTFGTQVREFLEHRAGGPRAAGPAGPSALSESALDPLRCRFLKEGQSQAREWEMALDGVFDPEPAAQAVHQWIGAAGLLGYPEISELARGLEIALRSRPIDIGELRDALASIQHAVAKRQSACRG